LYCPSCKYSKIRKEERKESLELIECPKCSIKDNEFTVFRQCEKFNYLTCPKCIKSFYYLESDVKDISNYFECPYSNCKEIFNLSKNGQLSLLKKMNNLNPSEIAKGRIHEFIGADSFIDLNHHFQFQKIKKDDIFMDELQFKKNKLYSIYQVPFINHVKMGDKIVSKGNFFHLILI